MAHAGGVALFTAPVAPVALTLRDAARYHRTCVADRSRVDSTAV